MYLSKKHGLNPSIKTCFWCGESTNEILLFGASYKRGEEAPMQVITDYQPCEKCLELFNQGILVVEASETPQHEDQPCLDQGYPTGHHWVITEEAIQRIFNQDATQQILTARKCMIGRELAEMLGFYTFEVH